MKTSWCRRIREIFLHDAHGHVPGGSYFRGEGLQTLESSGGEDQIESVPREHVRERETNTG